MLVCKVQAVLITANNRKNNVVGIADRFEYLVALERPSGLGPVYIQAIYLAGTNWGVG